MHDHSHHHHHSISHKEQKKKLWITIVLNILITIFLFIGGYLSKSLAVLSDALHNLSDVTALFVSLFAVMLSAKEHSKEKTYGYKRAEILAALINAASLALLAIFLCFEAFERLFHPANLDGKSVMVLAFISFIANAVSAFVLHKDAASSLNMRSAYLHLISDALSSVGVFVGGWLILEWQVFWVDSALAIGISIYLVFSGFKLFLESMKILMQFAPSHLHIEEIAEDISKVFPSIENVHHVHIWQLSDAQIHMEAHVRFKEDVALSTAVKELYQIKSLLRQKYNVHHMVFEAEHHNCDTPELLPKDCYMPSSL